MKKIISLLLAVFLCIFFFVSCNETNESSLTSNEIGSEKQTTGKEAFKIEFEKYSIIIPSEASQEISKAALKLYNFINEKFDAVLMITPETSIPSEYEIVIGATNRNIGIEDTEENEYTVGLSGNLIFAFGKNDTAISAAVTYLIENVLQPLDKNSPEINDKLFIKNTVELPKEEEYETMNIKIATYNIANGSYVDYDFKKLADDILNSGAEIVALQEVDQMTNRNGKQDTMKLLSEYTGFEYYKFVPALTSYQGGQFGIAVLSKYPINSFSSIMLPKTTSNEEQRAAMLAVIDLGETTFDFYVTHIQQISFEKQMRTINTFINDNSEGRNFILAGDFNYQLFATFNLIENSYIINNNTTKLITTINNQMFDNMAISNKIESAGIQTVVTGNSDHYMLFCNVTIKY